MAIWISLEPKRVYPWKNNNNNNNNNNKSLQQSTASAGIQTYIPEMLFSRGGGAYLFQAHLRQGLIETGGLFERGRLI